mmetsp:Transcript_23179/g.61703  ORF Transcript_23179/g.61703 Transcript_23179/m.61703 type:complete len:224 (-) Transcript_23179:111-782(-)
MPRTTPLSAHRLASVRVSRLCIAADPVPLASPLPAKAWRSRTCGRPHRRDGSGTESSGSKVHSALPRLLLWNAAHCKLWTPSASEHRHRRRQRQQNSPAPTATPMGDAQRSASQARSDSHGDGRQSMEEDKQSSAAGAAVWGLGNPETVSIAASALVPMLDDPSGLLVLFRRTGTDDRGGTLELIRGLGHNAMEWLHDCIQLMFPTDEASNFSSWHLRFSACL